MLIAMLLTVQMPWTVNLPDHGIALDILRPKLDGGGTSLTSVAAFASLRVRLGGETLRLELPFARLETEFSGGASTAFGNPYVAIESGRSTGLAWEIGLRGPLAPDDEIATELGAVSDFTRLEAFVPDVAVFNTRARYRFQDAGGTGFMFDAGGGPAVWFPTDGGDPDVVFNHHMMAGYRGATAWFAFGFGGFTIVTDGGGTIGERTLHQAGASFGFTTGKARPAVHAIVPLRDGFGANVAIVLGIGIAVTLN